MRLDTGKISAKKSDAWPLWLKGLFAWRQAGNIGLSTQALCELTQIPSRRLFPLLLKCKFILPTICNTHGPMWGVRYCDGNTLYVQPQSEHEDVQEHRASLKKYPWPRYQGLHWHEGTLRKESLYDYTDLLEAIEDEFPSFDLKKERKRHRLGNTRDRRRGVSRKQTRTRRLATRNS